MSASNWPHIRQRTSLPRTAIDRRIQHLQPVFIVPACLPLRVPRPDAHLSCRACLNHTSVESSEDSRQSLERIYRSDLLLDHAAHITELPFCQLATSTQLGTRDRLNPSPRTSSTLVEAPSVHQVQVGKPPGPPQNKQERQEDFYANLGDAIRTLREDVPICLKSEISYDIYREDVTFRDPRNTFHGIDNYKLIFWSLRFHGNLFFKQLYVEVKRIWQKDDDTICLRWTVHGFPRLPWDQEGTFDGVSSYKLDCHGKIYEHQVNNVIMSDPPLQRIPFFIRLSLDRVQQPLPSPLRPLPSPFELHDDMWFDSCCDTESHVC